MPITTLRHTKTNDSDSYTYRLSNHKHIQQKYSFYLLLALAYLGFTEFQDFAEDAERHFRGILRTDNQLYCQLFNELLSSFLFILLCFGFSDRFNVSFVLVAATLCTIYISLSSFLRESTI